MTPDDDTGLGLFVYDRPDHTRQVIEGLERNDIDHLYVFADGPKPDADTEAIEETRDIVRSIDFCDVDMVARSTNYGVRRSWIKGYEYIFDRHTKAIMLESDCVPGGDFIPFMQSCLNQYEDSERVMNVHGYCPQIAVPDSYPHDVFFTWRSGSWGQGTWSEAWDRFECDPGLLDRIENDSDLREKVVRAGQDLPRMLRNEVNGEIDSVGVWWSLTLALNDGLSINPVRSRIRNIGLDGSGRHSPETNKYDTEIQVDEEFSGISFPESVAATPALNDRYIRHIDGGRHVRVANKIRSIRQSLPAWLGGTNGN